MRTEQSERTSTPAYKRCPHCGKIKSVDEFWKRRASRDGLQIWCKQCIVNWPGRKASWNKFNRSHVAQRVAHNKRRYHELQEEACCHMRPRNFAPGLRFIRAMQSAEVVSI